MAYHHPVEADPKEIQRAKDTWASFTVLVKCAIAATIAVLAMLALIFVDW